MTDSYYELAGDAELLGEKFTATDLVRSTWSARIQHAAPVSALLVRALERCAPRDDTRLSRVVVDLLGPVPAEGELWVGAELVRSGAQIELVGATMLAAGPDGAPRSVARASGWRLQCLDTADVASAGGKALPPVSAGHNRDLARNFEPNYVHSVDWRWLTEPLCDGPGESWITPTVDLVAGEPMSPLQRLFAVADCANGVGAKLDIRRWTFLNTDLAVHIHRIPEGRWIGVRAEANHGPDGIGTTVGTLFDERGAVGAIQQSVLMRRRG